MTGGELARSRHHGLGALQQGEYFLLDGQLACIRKLIAVSGKNFDSIVGPGIVRGGDYDSGCAFAGARKISNSRRRDDAGAVDLAAAGNKPESNLVGDPGA